MFRYFYFRDPALTASIPDDTADEYREPGGSDKARALDALKERIKNSRAIVQVGPRPSETQDAPVEERSLPVFEYPCRWDTATNRIVDLQAFGDRVYRDLLESIEAEFGPAQPELMDEFAGERAAMEAFIESRVERYVIGGRQPVFDTLRDHADGATGNGYLCVVGEAGSGKSALLAKFYRDYTEAAREHAPRAQYIVIPHFVGASAASANVRQLLRRLCRELAVRAGISEEIPDNYDRVREAFPSILNRASANSRVIILIDAINQLDAAYEAHQMRWLPEELPRNVRVILSTLPGPHLDALRSRREPPVEVAIGPLDRSDATAIIDGFLARYRKTLDSAQRAQLLAKQDAGTPLYLLTALEELRTLGSYEEITDRIRELPGRVESLFDWILKRLEQDPGFRDEDGNLVGEDLVRRYCFYIAIGRSGMAQTELVELIVPANTQTNTPADHLGNVAALNRLLRAYLMQRGELLDFFHAQLRNAIKARYLRTEQNRRKAHGEVADHLQSKGYAYTRTVTELIYHLTEAARDENLIEVMSGEYPDIKLGRLLSVAEVAHDYALAVDACERLNDLTHAVSFSFRRSLMSAHARALEYRGVPWLVGRLATAEGDLDSARRAEALAREFITQDDARALTLIGLADGLLSSPDRERLLRDAAQILSRLPAGEVFDSVAVDFVAACLGESGVPRELVNRALEMSLTNEAAKVRVVCLWACHLWWAGAEDESRALLESDLPGWLALPVDSREQALATARLVREQLSLPAAAELLECATGEKKPEEVYNALLSAAWVGRCDWMMSTAMRVKGSWGLRNLGLLALMALAEKTDAAIKSASRFFHAEAVSAALLDWMLRLAVRGYMRDFMATTEPRKSDSGLEDKSANAYERSIEWEALGLALARSGLDAKGVPKNLNARLAFLRNQPPLGDDEIEAEWKELLGAADSIIEPREQRKALLAIARASIQSGLPQICRQSLDRWTERFFDKQKLRVVRRGDRSLIFFCGVFLLLAAAFLYEAVAGTGPIAFGPRVSSRATSLVLGGVVMFIGLAILFYVTTGTRRRLAAWLASLRGNAGTVIERRQSTFQRLRVAAEQHADHCFAELQGLIKEVKLQHTWPAPEVAAARLSLGIQPDLRKGVYLLLSLPFSLLLFFGAAVIAMIFGLPALLILAMTRLLASRRVKQTLSTQAARNALE